MNAIPSQITRPTSLKKKIFFWGNLLPLKKIKKKKKDFFEKNIFFWVNLPLKKIKKKKIFVENLKVFIVVVVVMREGTSGYSIN